MKNRTLRAKIEFKRDNFLVRIFRYIFKLNRCRVCRGRCRKKYCPDCDKTTSHTAMQIMKEEDKRLLELMKNWKPNEITLEGKINL